MPKCEYFCKRKGVGNADSNKYKHKKEIRHNGF